MTKESIALNKAIKAAGGAGALAARLGITPQALSQWDRVPVMRVLHVEKITGTPRHQLRPDIYPPRDAVADPEHAA